MNKSGFGDDTDNLELIMQEYSEIEELYKQNSITKIPTVKAHDEDLLLKSIFGNKASLIENLSSSLTKNNGSSGESKKQEEHKKVWSDSDDESMVNNKSYKEYVTKQYKKIVNQPKWAELNKKQTKEADSSDSENIQRTANFLDKNGNEQVLDQQYIKIKQLKNLNRSTYYDGNINSIQFHPTSMAALIAGESGVASIYCVDGQQNEKLHTIKFNKFPIKCVKITPCGTKAFFGSIKRYYYSYDLLLAKETKLYLPRSINSLKIFELSPCGRYIASVGNFGEVHLLTANTNEIIHKFLRPDVARSICFTKDSSRLICNGKGSSVNIFSLRQQRMEHSFSDDGCINGSSIHLAPNQRLMATGSMEGIVNVYNFDNAFLSHNPKPEKTFTNLTTAISQVRFNHSSQLLAMCSKEVSASVKLANFPTAKVYRNFPDHNSKLGRVKIIEFSPSSGYMCFGNMGKKIPLFRLKQFQNY